MQESLGCKESKNEFSMRMDVRIGGGQEGEKRAKKKRGISMNVARVAADITQGCECSSTLVGHLRPLALCCCCQTASGKSSSPKVFPPSLERRRTGTTAALACFFFNLPFCGACWGGTAVAESERPCRRAPGGVAVGCLG